MEKINVLIINGQRLAIVGCSDEDAIQLAKAISLANNVSVFIEKQDPLDFIEKDPREEFIEVTNDLHLTTIDDYEPKSEQKSYRQNVQDFLVKNQKRRNKDYLARKPRLK